MANGGALSEGCMVTSDDDDSVHRPLTALLDFVRLGGFAGEWYAGLLPGAWERSEERLEIGGEG
jgi:hypothetical protein